MGEPEERTDAAAAAEQPGGPSPSRRRFLAGAVGAAGLVGGGVAGYALRAGTASAAAPAPAPSTATATATSTATPTTTTTQTTAAAGVSATDKAAAVVDFYGERQSGITTAQQERLMFAALDITSTSADDVQRLLGRWAAMAARFTAGKPVSDSSGSPDAPPLDTGEAEDLGPYSLTVTVGFGASMFDGRFGLAGKLPAALQPLGQVAGDTTMQSALTGGDLCIQACADDPQVVFHAVRNMVRAARGTAVLRWSQLGFGRASATGAGQSTPRNLMGFKDGTNNIHADDTAAVGEYVWVDDGDQAWMRGGSYLVARKIRMEIESWDTDDLEDQQKIFGRLKGTGAPLTGGSEFTPLDFGAKDAAGAEVIDQFSHVRLASPEMNNGVRLLRRGYNYTDGQDPETGKLAAGLFFIAFQKDPHAQFKVLQNRLGARDLLNEYIAHIGGGVWAVPPGVQAAGDWFGKQLFQGTP
jgi:deferrochelatase/peroxidase EfeB